MEVRLFSRILLLKCKGELKSQRCAIATKN